MDLVQGVKAAAEYLCCGERTLRRHIATGRMPAPEIELVIGGQVQRAWRKDSLNRFKKKLRRPGRPKRTGD